MAERLSYDLEPGSRGIVRAAAYPRGVAEADEPGTGGDGRPPAEVRALLACLVVTAAAVALGISLATGTPDDLPDAALGSDALFHAERALALFVIAMVVLVVVAQTLRHGLPTEIGRDAVRWPEHVRQTLEQQRSARRVADSDVLAEITDIRARLGRLEDAAAAAARRRGPREGA